MRLYLLSIIIACGLLDPARSLQIFNGTLTEITCSAAVPVFRLVDQEMKYDSRNYDQLPDLFDIEAIPSPNRDNVTLIINGTDHSNNLIIMCTDEDAFTGQFQILFTLILEFIGILPAPKNVQFSEDPAGHLQIFWEPPTLVSDKLGSQNVSIDSRITHFEIYITTEESTILQVYNASGTSFSFENGNISCSFWFQVAAVNPAGVGEHSPPQNLDSHAECIGFTNPTTVMIVEPIPVSSKLSVGGVIAIIIGVVLIIVGLFVVSAIIFTLKLKNDKHRRVKQSLKSQIRSDQLSDTKDSVAEIEKYVESDHCGSGNDPNTVDDNNINQPSHPTPTRTYSYDGPPVCSYLYAEIDVVAKRKNKVPEPSSNEDISCHVYAVLEQPSNQVIDTDQDDHSDSQN